MQKRTNKYTVAPEMIYVKAVNIFSNLGGFFGGKVETETWDLSSLQLLLQYHKDEENGQGSGWRGGRPIGKMNKTWQTGFLPGCSWLR